MAIIQKIVNYSGGFSSCIQRHWRDVFEFSLFCNVMFT